MVILGEWLIETDSWGQQKLCKRWARLPAPTDQDSKMQREWNHGLWNQTREPADLAINLPYFWREGVRYHFTPVRMTSIKKDEIANVRGRGKKGTLVHCWWDCQLVRLQWKTLWRFLKKLKMQLSHEWAPAIPLLVYIQKEIKTLC